MSDVFDDIIDREASPADTARVAAVIASDFRFSYFGTAAFAVRLLRQSKAHRWHPDESPAHGEPAQCDIYADGRAVEIPVV